MRLAVCNQGPAQRPEVGEGIAMPPTTPAGPDTPGRRARPPGSLPQAPPGQQGQPVGPGPERAHRGRGGGGSSSHADWAARSRARTSPALNPEE